jgi:hypothetical protein
LQRTDTTPETNSLSETPAAKMVPPVPFVPQTLDLHTPAEAATKEKSRIQTVPSLADYPEPSSPPVRPKMVTSTTTLPKRRPTTPKADLPPPTGRPFNPVGQGAKSRVTNTKRKPEEIQDMLSRFRSGSVSAKDDRSSVDPSSPPLGKPASGLVPPPLSGTEETSTLPESYISAAKPLTKRVTTTQLPESPQSDTPVKEQFVQPMSPAPELSSITMAVSDLPPPLSDKPVGNFSASSSGLQKRVPKTRMVRETNRRGNAKTRTPEEVREALTRYRSGIKNDNH